MLLFLYVYECERVVHLSVQEAFGIAVHRMFFWIHCKTGNVFPPSLRERGKVTIKSSLTCTCDTIKGWFTTK